MDALGAMEGPGDIGGILFDKDGTLFDFHTTWGAWARRFFMELADGDRDTARRLAAPLGYDIDTGAFQPTSVIIAGTPDEVAAALLPALPHLAAAELVARINRLATDVPQAEPVPLIPLMQGLRGAGLALGVATNDAEAPARAHLDRAGVTGLFDFLAGCASGHGAKPDTGMLLAFCAATGLSPDRVVMVGDSLHDLLAGRAAGMRTAGVLTGLATEAELAPHADVVLPHVGHLPGWLGLPA